MDHLPLPAQPTHELPRVPLLSLRPYDGGDFLTYPRRVQQRDLNRTEEGALTQSADVDEAQQDLQELNALVQTWIFFGLLNELLGPCGLFDANEYIANDALGDFLHTKGLVGRLEQWSQQVSEWAEEKRSEYSTHLNRCIWLSADILKIFAVTFIPRSSGLSALPAKNVAPWVNEAYQVLRELSNDGKVEMENSIKMCLASLAEQISGLGEAFLDDTLDWTHFGRSVHCDGLDPTHMLKNGWCPSEIQPLGKVFSSLSGSIFLETMRKPDFGLSHSKCTEQSCINMQIDSLDKYEPSHTNQNCNCPLIGAPYEDIVDCLVRGTYPVLTFTDSATGEFQLNVVPYDEHTNYVAISHVWADGLGNPKEPMIRECQVERLRKLVNSLTGKIFKWQAGKNECKEEGALLLWCDSLCVPCRNDKVHQNMAMAKMRETYANAKYVLVLDGSLQAMNMLSMQPIEIAMRVLTCRWMRRLWTFQEAAAAKKLLIQFENDVVDHWDVFDEIHSLRSKGLLHTRIASQLCAESVYLKGWFEMKSGEPQLNHLVRAISYRRVTEQGDEPLCLGAVLELDVPALVRTGDAQRMEALWKMKAQRDSGIPSDLVFANLPRIGREGWRWAPRTLQKSQVQESSAIVDEFDRGDLTGSGLRVRRTAWRLRLHPAPMFFQQNYAGDLLYARHPDGRWFTVSISSMLQVEDDLNLHKVFREGRAENIRDALLDQDSQWVVVFRGPEGSNLGNTTLLASMSHKQSVDVLLQSAAIVELAELDPNFSFILSKARDVALALAQTYIVRNWWLSIFVNKLRDRLPLSTQWLPIRQQIIRACLAVPVGLGSYATMIFFKAAQKKSAAALKSPDLAKAWEILPHKPTGMGFMAFVFLIVFGNTAYFEEQPMPEGGYIID